MKWLREWRTGVLLGVVLACLVAVSLWHEALLLW